MINVLGGRLETIGCRKRIGFLSSAFIFQLSFLPAMRAALPRRFVCAAHTNELGLLVQIVKDLLRALFVRHIVARLCFLKPHLLRRRATAACLCYAERLPQPDSFLRYRSAANFAPSSLQPLFYMHQALKWKSFLAAQGLQTGAEPSCFEQERTEDTE